MRYSLAIMLILLLGLFGACGKSKTDSKKAQPTPKKNVAISEKKETPPKEQAAAPEKKEPAPKENATIKLFNGENFEGWKFFTPNEKIVPTRTWKVNDGVIQCTGKPSSYMRTTEQYENYRLTFEWRWPGSGGNSGVLLHLSEPDKLWPKSIKVQLGSGNAGDLWVIDGTDFKEHTYKNDNRVTKKTEHSEKPAKEWNHGKIVCKSKTIQVWVNDVLQNEATETTVAKGYIGFQSEETPIEFRNIMLEPLTGE